MDPSVSTDTDDTGSRRVTLRQASRIAGWSIVVMSAFAVFGYGVVVAGMVSDGHPVRTAENIAESQTLFRLGVASLIVVVVLDVVAAWALFLVFRPVNESLSMLAALLRAVYAGVFMVAVGHLVEVVRLVNGDGYLGALSASDRSARALLEVGTFNDIWYVGQVLFGLHLVCIGYLAYRAVYVPKLIGILLVVAGSGYVIDGLGTVLHRGTWTAVSAFTFVGELLLALWLVLRPPREAAR